MGKCPYDFSLRSRQDIITFLTRRGRSYFTWRTGYAPLTWNIKCHRYDNSGHNRGRKDYPINCAYDAVWSAWLEQIANPCTGERNEDRLFWQACEDGLRDYRYGYATVWPGEEIDGKFIVLGRSGGYLCLESWNGHRLWHRGSGGADDFLDWLRELPFRQLRELYKLVVCLDQDIQPEAEISYQFHFQRMQWEEEHIHKLAMTFPHEAVGNYTAGAFI
ncbi:hypothetical protein IQ273_07785 [Nodosilinea sp. LEGE 07298]|uniref:hypothetical protein n=1 Tax=Nodosilinea sp. LEGE 07298 TaxID=2777970 RepID=UPI00187E7AD5|nr:hypothetical protein [Nodosilinea sp. LEGE 07298]MBE9109314.1 hypothetical protein [Nodosilinea sp. LEGE 07298]